MMRIEIDSTEYIYIPIEATTSEGEVIDVTRVAVEAAFTRDRIGPVAEDWLPAVWATVDDVEYARVLVGPRNGGHRLDPGRWWVWVRFHASPEVPVRRSDYLLVTGDRPSELTQIGGGATLTLPDVGIAVGAP